MTILTDDEIKKAIAPLYAGEEVLELAFIVELDTARAEFEHVMKAEPNGFGPDWFDTDQYGDYTSEEMYFRWLGWQDHGRMCEVCPWIGGGRRGISEVL